MHESRGRIHFYLRVIRTIHLLLGKRGCHRKVAEDNDLQRKRGGRHYRKEKSKKNREDWGTLRLKMKVKKKRTIMFNKKR